MILKTHAIVLRIVPYSETSLVVSWLTEDHGRIGSIIKGAHRRKSNFAGQYDLFYTCELLFYFKSYEGLHIVKECMPLASRPLLRDRWKSAACASYLSDLVSRIAPVHAVHPELYSWLDGVLDVLNSHAPVWACIFWFELKLMEIMGFSPQLTACLKCGCGVDGYGRSGYELVDAAKASGPVGAGQSPGFAKSGAARFFSSTRGGVYCSACGRGASGDAFIIAPDILGLLRFLQSSPSWRSAQSTRCTDRQIGATEKLLGMLMQSHMGVSLDGRNVAFEMLRIQPC